MLSNISKKHYQQYYLRGDYNKPEYRELHNYAFNSLLQKVDLRHAKLLEIGCGDGYLAKKLLTAGLKTYIGVDFTAIAIELAAHNLAGFHDCNINLINQDLKDVDYNSLGFNTVVAVAMEHYFNPYELFQGRQLNIFEFKLGN